MASPNTELQEFRKAVSSLRLALDAPLTDLNRDATIQRFEFCIELAWKVSKKVLGTSSSAPKTVIREMAQDGLIDNPEIWLGYVDLRNLTVHTYREALAKEVYEKCKPFLKDVLQLLKKLEERVA